MGLSSESLCLEDHARLVGEWRVNRNRLLLTRVNRPAADRTLSVSEPTLAYWRYVEGYYVKASRRASEQDNIRQALRLRPSRPRLRPVVEFGPVALRGDL